MADQHTPGPWEARGLTIWEPSATALSVAVVTQHHKDARSNARLIAAAPDMLQLIKDIEESLTADGTYRGLQEACRAVMAKVGG